METINMRFKELRNACKKSQEEFGKILGLSKSGISEIESGRRNVTEQHLIMLRTWGEKSVNEEWLRTGSGEMFNSIDDENKLMAWAGSVLSESDESFRRRFIKMLMELDESDWVTLEKVALKLRNKKD